MAPLHWLALFSIVALRLLELALNINLRLAEFFHWVGGGVVRGVHLTFPEYLKARAPITLATLTIGIIALKGVCL